jgi:hypothetical protein
MKIAEWFTEENHVTSTTGNLPSNVRIRIQRLSDAKFLNGWLGHIEGDEVRAQLNGTVVPEPGQTFMFEASVENAVLTFQCECIRFVAKEAVFRITTGITKRPSSDEARVRVKDIYGTITREWEEFPFALLDIAANGLAAQVPAPLNRGDIITLRFDSSMGEINCDGEVRYCRGIPDAEGHYRLGIRLSISNRLENARWRSLIDQNAA